MTAADRYPPTSRRRRSGQHADPLAVTVPRGFLLEQIRAQTVMLNAWRALAGLGPVPSGGGAGSGQLDNSAQDMVE